MLSTGAFEIYVNDVLEYSKIQTGRMPDMGIIADIMQKYNINV
jgi:selT/selW/selH-like putative selenoprotein